MSHAIESNGATILTGLTVMPGAAGLAAHTEHATRAVDAGQLLLVSCKGNSCTGHHGGAGTGDDALSVRLVERRGAVCRVGVLGGALGRK